MSIHISNEKLIQALTNELNREPSNEELQDFEDYLKEFDIFDQVLQDEAREWSGRY